MKSIICFFVSKSVINFLARLFFSREESLISQEGIDILQDKEMTKKLNLMVDEYKSNGSWNLEIIEK